MKIGLTYIQNYLLILKKLKEKESKTKEVAIMTGISSQEHYVDVSTQKRDDSYVITSVWFSQEGGNK